MICNKVYCLKFVIRERCVKGTFMELYNQNRGKDTKKNYITMSFMKYYNGLPQLPASIYQVFFWGGE